MFVACVAAHYGATKRAEPVSEAVVAFVVQPMMAELGSSRYLKTVGFVLGSERTVVSPTVADLETVLLVVLEFALELAAKN